MSVREEIKRELNVTDEVAEKLIQCMKDYQGELDALIKKMGNCANLDLSEDQVAQIKQWISIG